MPEETCVHRAFEREARRGPERVAVKHGEVNVTYEELNQRANFLASHLQENGVQRGDSVALAMPRSIEMIVSMLAVLKCGGAYVPLDESNPLARNLACLEVTKARMVITDGNGDALCRGGRRSIDSRRAELFHSRLETPPSLVSASDDRAYIMFTSGSTGKPKGVAVPHRAVLRLVNGANYIDITTADSILQLSPISFDASTFEIWGALLNGATLVMYSGTVLDPNLLKSDVREHGVTILWLTAALFHLIGDRYVEAIESVRVVLAGGDVLHAKVVNKVLDAVPGITLINGYGPTENTTFTCCHRMTVHNRPTHRVPIGTPISGTRVLILDDHLQPVRHGEVGELYASGEGVALGYLGEARNSESFFVDENLAEGLIYRTGDLVRENRAGEIEFIGRRDNQVKVRGYRVALEEVNASIMRFDGVIDSVVFLHGEESGDQMLVAYLQMSRGSETSCAEVRRYLSTELPRYMIPDKIVLETGLPVTSNGKLDRDRIRTGMIEARQGE